GPQHESGRRCRPAADRGANLGQPAGSTAAGDVSAPDYQVRVPLAQNVEHFAQDGFVVLQIAVDDCNVRRRGAKNSLNQSACAAAPVDPMQTADTRILARKLLYTCCGPVRAVVI